MGDHEDKAGLRPLLETVEDGLGSPLVQVPGRLVAEDELRVLDQGTRDGDSLLLSSGELVRVLVPVVEQSHLLQCPVGTLLLVLGIGYDIEGKHHVLSYRELVDQLVVLEDESAVARAVVASLLVREAGDVLAVDEDLAGGRLIQGPKPVEQGGLSASALA